MFLFSRIFFYLLLSISLFSKEREILIYEKTSGKGSLQLTYSIEKVKDEYSIHIQSADHATEIAIDSPFQFACFAYNSKKNKDAYTLKVKGHELIAKGNMKGVAFEETFPVSKKLPWIQEFNFGLLPLLNSKKTVCSFQIFNPKNFKTYKMSAKKQGIKPLTIDDKTQDALLVYITLQGFKSMFWRAEVWYDPKTFDLLLYKANEGPHTPTTTISLVSKTLSLD